MYLNQFSVRIREGKEKSSGYVEIEHGTQYTIHLRNDRSVRCEAEVSVDGKYVGTFRISPHSSIRLERPGHDKGKFTFYRTSSEEGEKVGAQEINPSKRGLVSVTFTPEKEWKEWRVWTSVDPYPCPHQPYWYPQSPGRTVTYTPIEDTDDASYTDSAGSNVSVNYYAVSRRSVQSSPTSLSCSGDQESGVTGLSGESSQRFVPVGSLQLDYSQQTTINLRLVAPKHVDNDPRPLTQMANPVPPAIE